jgi:hypothetical protein
MSDHTANNKQKVVKRQRLVKVNHLLGQLNSGKKAAAVWKFNHRNSQNTKAVTRLV